MLSDSERQRFDAIANELTFGTRTSRRHRRADRRASQPDSQSRSKARPIVWAEARFDERLRRTRDK